MEKYSIVRTVSSVRNRKCVYWEFKILPGVCDTDMVKTLVRVLVRDDEDYGKGEKEWDPRSISGVEFVSFDYLVGM